MTCTKSPGDAIACLLTSITDMDLSEIDPPNERAIDRRDAQPGGRPELSLVGDPAESEPRRVNSDQRHYLPPLNTRKGTSRGVWDVEESRRRSSTLDPNISRGQGEREKKDEATLLPGISEILRPRSSSFHGCDTAKTNSHLPRTRQSFQEYSSPPKCPPAQHIVYPMLPSGRSHLKAVHKPSKFKNAVLKVMEETSYLKTAAFFNAQKRASVASIVGLVAFRQLYNARLDVYAKKQIEENEKEVVSSDSEESSDDEDEVSIEPGFFSGLSDVAKLAYLKAYEDKLRTGLERTYPRYSKDICRSKSQCFVEAKNKDNDGDDSSETQGTRFTGELMKVTKLMDALKVDRGEEVTSTSFGSTQGDRGWKSRQMKTRPKSKRLVRKFNAWANSWSPDKNIR